jgi:hypothetical protein
MDASTLRTLEVGVRSAPTFRNGWIFSPLGDLVIFGAPLVLGLQLMWLDEHVGLDGLTVGRWSLFTLAFAVAAFVDGGHLLSTAFRSYFDPEVRRRHNRLLYWGPPCVAAALIALELAFGSSWLVIGFTYFQTYHVMRQQYGWVSLASVRAGEAQSPVDRLFDKIVIYGSVLFPMAWAHVARPLNARRIPMSPSPELASLFIAGFGLCLCLYLGRVIYKRLRGQPINGAKLYIVAATALAWGGMLVFYSRMWPFLVTMHHGISYAAIVFVTTRTKISRQENIVARLWKHKLAAPVFGIGMLGTAYMWDKVLRLVAGLPGVEHTGLSLTWLGAMTPVMHFLIDGVIWRRKA